MVIRAAWGLAACLGLGCPALADGCRLALVLALDVSSSLNRDEQRLQCQGLARALLDPEVVRAFLAGEPVALYVFEWAHPTSQVPLSDGWHLVESEADLVRIAGVIAARPASPRPNGPTALGAALSHAAAVLRDGPDCQARTIDVAGDGANNTGPSPQALYETRLLDGVRVNALIVDSAAAHNGLAAWFETEVLHGPGAFWVVADGYEDYARAMRIKLLRELEQPLVSEWHVPGREALRASKGPL